MQIHPLAVVSPQAHLGQDVAIGPFCVVERGATVGDRTILESRVTIKTGATLGSDNHVFDGAVLGGIPQHLKLPERLGTLRIGAGNTIRENVTIHRGLSAEQATIVGDANLLMVNVHVAHDCHLGNHVIMANNSMLAGHIEVQDRAYISGAVGVHQFCRVGRLAMVGGQSHVVKDVPPYVTVDGATTLIVGLNLVGLRRAGFDREAIGQLKDAYKLIYRGGLKWVDVVARLAVEFPTGPAAEFHRFFSGGARGFTPERRMPRGATLKLPDDAVPRERRRARLG